MTSVNITMRIPYIIGFLLMFYNLSIILNLFIAIIVVAFVLMLPLNSALLLYLFLFPWEFSLTLPVVGTLNTLVAIVLSFKMLVNYAFRRIGVGLNKLNIPLLSILSVYSIVDLMVHKSIAGFGVLLDAIILIYIHKIKRENRDQFWAIVFRSYVISVILACIYGVIHNSFNPRWISGIGFVPQFYGTVGTSRMALLINIAILFTLVIPSYSKTKKALILLFLYPMLFMTISMAGLGSNLIVVLYYLFIIYPRIGERNLKRRSAFRSLQTSVILMLIVFLLYVFGDSIPFVSPVVARATRVINWLSSGDIDRATSGRAIILDSYLDVFRHLPLVNRLFGLGCFSSFSVLGFVDYSHNSFIDLLFLGGFFLLTWFILLLAYIIHRERDSEYFDVVLLMKAILIINGFNVSMLTAGFWYFWVFI